MAVAVKGSMYDGVRGAKIEFGTFTLNPASLNSSSEAETTLALEGAVAGDLIFATPRALTTGLVMKGVRVTTTDTIGVHLANILTAAVDGAEATYDYLIVKFSGDAQG